MKRFASALIVLVLFAAAIVRAAVIKVGGMESPNAVFVPDSVRIAAGDTVQWYQINGDHTSTSGVDSNDPNAGSDYNGVFGSVPMTFSFQFNTPGSYSNFCIPHEIFGMKGKIVVTPSVAAHVAANGAVTNFFDPDSVAVPTGSTVEFYWGNGGDHTLTSGTGSGDPNAGNLINSPLNFETPAVQLTFNSPGTYPFFCVPHELEGMQTKVYVSDPCNCPCKYDPQCDGVLSNVQDVVGTVNVAFRGTPGVTDPGCPSERTDVNASGFTNVQDVVAVVNVAFRGASVASTYVDPCL